MQGFLGTETWPLWARLMCHSKADEVSLAWGQASMPLALAPGFLDFPETKKREAHVDTVDGDTNNAEIIEQEEQEPGQVDRTSGGQQGTQHE